MPGQGGNFGTLGTTEIHVTANYDEMMRHFDEARAMTSSKTKELESSVRVSMQGVDAAVNRHGQSAARGLLQLGYAIDDMQYGFSAIVNNIPQIVYAMGGGPGLAGVVGILAVGINLAINHWDQLKATFSDTSAWQTAVGAIEQVTAALKDQDTIIGKLYAESGLKDTADFAQEQWAAGAVDRKMAEEAKKKEEETKKAAEAIKNFVGPEERARGRIFGDVLGEFGGPEKLLKQMMARALADRGGKVDPEMDKAIREHFTRMIFEAMKGKDVGGAFDEILGPARLAVAGRGKLLANMPDDLAKQVEKAQKDRLREEHDGRMQAIEDRREKLQDERQDAQYRQQLRGMKQAQIFNSPLEYAMAAQTGDRGEAKKTLEINRAMDMKLRDIRDELKKERRAKFGP